MSFQWIIDNAQDIEVDKLGVASQTVSRDQTVRTVERGNKSWKFSVTPSAGLRWGDTGVRGYIAAVEFAGRSTKQYISFNKTGHEYLFKYQGNGITTGMIATATTGGFQVGTSGGTVSSGYRFRAGDIIQWTLSGSIPSSVYTVVADVAYNSTTTNVNRAILEYDHGGTYPLVVGSACQFRVICTSMPTYRITSLGIIDWNGKFEFMEAPY